MEENYQIIIECLFFKISVIGELLKKSKLS